jgi:hypothetical protein
MGLKAVGCFIVDLLIGDELGYKLLVMCKNEKSVITRRTVPTTIGDEDGG